MLIFIVLIVLTVYLFVKWTSRNYDFFEKQGIKFKKPYPLIGTNVWLSMRQNIAETMNRFYCSFPDEKVFGLFDFQRPFYVIRDPELVKHLAIKEFDNFPDHIAFIDTKVDELFGSMLSVMKGKKWKEMRAALSPAFTGSKMRLMFDLVSAVGQQMTDHFRNEYATHGPISYDIKDLFSRFTNDVIATCAFGLKCDSFKNPKNEFFQIGQSFLSFRRPLAMLKFFLIRFLPRLSKLIGISFVSKANRNIFYDMIIETMNAREREKIVRPDLINLLIRLKKGELNDKDADVEIENDGIAAVNEVKVASDGKKTIWSDNELIAQCFIFFLAGFETSSGLMTFVAYELATNPDVQEKLIEEVYQAKESLAGKPLTYEVLNSMKYLDMVISETLRKWPPAFVTDRACSKDFTYDDSNGLKFKIDKGSFFWIPIYAYHMDSKYFPEPEKFIPERFSDENKHNINFNAYLPFGIGPRNCIGSRFALMEMKVAMYYLLLNFSFEVCSETVVPVQLQRSIGGLIPEKKIKLKLKPRTN